MRLTAYFFLTLSLWTFTACTDRNQYQNDNDQTGTATQGSSGQVRTGNEIFAPIGSTSGRDPARRLSKKQVLRVEQLLQERGYDIEMNGVLTAEDAQKVEHFQSENGLVPTGRIDVPTLEKLGLEGFSTDRQPASTK